MTMGPRADTSATVWSRRNQAGRGLHVRVLAVFRASPTKTSIAAEPIRIRGKKRPIVAADRPFWCHGDRRLQRAVAVPGFRLGARPSTGRRVD